MWAPRWLRTLARRKSGAAYEALRAAHTFTPWCDGFHPVGKQCNLPSAASARLPGDAYVRYEPDTTRFRQDLRPIPSWSPRHTYGGKGTIHNTTTIDVQLDEQTGEVVAVWFRCLNLPFTVSTVDHQPVNNPAEKAIEEITYVELPREEGSQ